MITAKPGTCEEASMFAPPGCYLPCGNPAVTRVHHRRDDRTYNMCEMCADHNIKNRGGEDRGPCGQIERWPGIRKAALEIAYDNGMINRECSEDAWLKSLDPVLGAEGVTDEDLDRLDAWLLGLSDADLDTLCSGEERDAEGIEADCPTGGPDGERLSKLLVDIFECPWP